MKHYYCVIIASLSIILGILGIAPKCYTQSALWNNYEVVDTTETYTPLAGGAILPGIIPGGNPNVPIQFLNSSGEVDMNDGTADSIPTGFTFDYNGMSCNSVNININGWVSFNPVGSTGPVPFITSTNNYLFSDSLPKNMVAPYWGDHYYRTKEPGYTPSTISFLTTAQPAGNPNSPDTSLSESFAVEWKNLNVNNSVNSHSVASFQLHIIIHRTDTGSTDAQRQAIIEFDYAPLGDNDMVETNSDIVGAKDSTGLTHLNALFQTSEFNGDSTRLSIAKTTCWPPPSCTPGVEILLEPVSVPASVSNLNASVPNSIQIYPNPFSQSTTISFLSPESAAAEVTIVNMLGSEVARLFEGELETGQHTLAWNAVGLPSGTYWAMLKMNENIVYAPIVLQASQ